MSVNPTPLSAFFPYVLLAAPRSRRLQLDQALGRRLGYADKELGDPEVLWTLVEKRHPQLLGPAPHAPASCWPDQYDSALRLSDANQLQICWHCHPHAAAGAEDAEAFVLAVGAEPESPQSAEPSAADLAKAALLPNGLGAAHQDALLLLDEQERVLFWNAAAEQIFGFAPAESVGRPMRALLSFCSPQSEPQSAALQLASLGLGAKLERVAVTSKGQKVPVELFAYPVLVHDRPLTLLHVRDLCAQKRTEEALRAAQARLRHLLVSSPAVIYSCELTPPHDATFISDNVETWLGYGPSEIIQQPGFWTQHVHPDDRSRVATETQEVLQGALVASEYRVQKRDGQYAWLRDIRNVVRSDDGLAIEIVGSLIDISDSKRSEKEYLHLSNALRQTADHVFITDDRGRIEYVNPAFERITGYRRDEIIGKTPRVLKSGQHDGDFYRNLWTTLLSGGVFHAEIINRKQSGDLYFDETTITPVRDVEGKITHFVAVGRDITDRKLRDPLTGLPNRTLVTDRIGHSLARTKRWAQHLFSVLFIDIDRFKLINDTFGYAIGDQLLMEFAKRLGTSVRQSDTVSHIGRLDRDEFAVLLEDLRDISDAQRVADRIRKLLAEPLVLDNREIFSTVSIGIALSSTGYQRPEDMLRDAETAMLRAKSIGKGNCQVFDQTMHARSVARLQLESELRQAIEHKEFRVYYQPIVSLTEGQITGFEALVRWQHPQRGLVPPMEFIPIAEQTGLILPIGELVLKDACLQLNAWHQNGYCQLTAAVNLSQRQFSQKDLVKMVDRVLTQTGLNPRSLKLEITESTAASDPQAAIATLHDLRALGVQLLMDDFGTGYSSLSYLTRFPLDKLKIDRSFIMHTPQNKHDVAVVTTIIAMAHNLDLHLIAEGVETPEQLQLLQSLGCEEMQGYYFSPPVPEEKFSEFLRQNRRLQDLR